MAVDTGNHRRVAVTKEVGDRHRVHTGLEGLGGKPLAERPQVILAAVFPGEADGLFLPFPDRSLVLDPGIRKAPGFDAGLLEARWPLRRDAELRDGLPAERELEAAEGAVDRI